MKDKSIKSTMKSWIMLSDKELDDTQVYMKEQEGENTCLLYTSPSPRD